MNRTDLETRLDELLSAHFRFVRADLYAADEANAGKGSAEKHAAAEEYEDAFRTARASFLDAVGRPMPDEGVAPIRDITPAELAEVLGLPREAVEAVIARNAANRKLDAKEDRYRPLEPGDWSKLMAALPGGGVFSPEKAAEIMRESSDGPLPATWPGTDPLDRSPEKSMDAAFPRVEVARKTDPIPRVTVTPPASDIAGELARHIRDNLARLAAEPDLPMRLISPVRGTLDMAERLVEAVALLEEQHEHMGERLQAANMLGHRRALALSLRCAELNTSEQARAELAELLRRHQQDPAHQTPIIVPDVPMVPVYSIDELARAIAERITEKLAAEPLLRLLDAARAWADCPHQTAACEELQTFLDAMHACQNIRTGREPADGSAT